MTEKVLSTVCTTEELGQVTLTTTEKVVQRGDKTVKVTEKRYKGPKKQVERLQWKKFGAAAKEPSMKCTNIGPEVFFEFVGRDEPDDWVPNGFYIKRAREDDWSDQEIKQIIRSNRPDKVWEKIYRSKMNALMTEIKHKQAKETEVALKVRGIEPTEVPAPNAGKATGLRARLQQRAAARSSTEGGKPSGGKSIAERLSAKKQSYQDDEQKCTLFVTNVPYEYTEKDIRSLLEDFEICRINVVRKENYEGVKESIGKAFVVLQTTEETARCLEYLNGAGSRWGYSIISADYSKPRS